MKRPALPVIAGLLLTGCATVTDYWHSAGWLPGSTPRKETPGEPVASANPQKKATKGKGGAAATDQSLFRRALLALKPNRETIVSKRSRQILERLKKEYPSSPWSAPANQVNELIQLADELSRQNKELKSDNESLSREVDELNHNIEQMKHLDMELEKSR